MAGGCEEAHSLTLSALGIRIILLAPTFHLCTPRVDTTKIDMPTTSTADHVRVGVRELRSNLSSQLRQARHGDFISRNVPQ